MLLKKSILDAIAAGFVTLVFRRWRRPTVRPGGTLKTRIGLLAIHEVTAVAPERITDQEAILAGYASADAVRAELATRTEGDVYRIGVAWAGEDPRVTLRAEARLDTETLETVAVRLKRLDGTAPWTERALGLIAQHPGMRAADLARMIGRETRPFKIDIRKLKALGLTESLDVGYRLSPRGWSVLAHLKGHAAP